MKIISKPLRYAHAEGHTDVCYTENGQHIITCGRDGDVRIWVNIEDDDPDSHCVGESAVAICFKENRIFVSTDSHAVQAYTFPAFDKDGIVTRFTAPVTQIMSTVKMEALGCASENMEAKICNPEGGAPLFIMSEHKGPVLSIAICPHMRFACTASGDGTLRIWDIDIQKIVKEINCVPKINTFFSAKVLCRMDFEPTEGKLLAYPNNREVMILDCENWSQRMTFTHNTIKCAISQCLFSPCGLYLAASSVAGQIAIWEVQGGNCIGVIEHPTSHNVTAMAWNPKGNGVLAYCDIAGQMGMLINCYGTNTDICDAENDMDGLDVQDEVVDNLILQYESDDDDNAISLEKLKNSTLGLNLHHDDSRPPSQQTNIVSAPVTVQPQPPFQPSSTPSHLEHRYLCWNDCGIVRCHATDNGESTIDVEFHDTNVHHGIHLNNYLNHTMASLSTTVLALACETPSKLVCISLVGSSKEWSMSLPDTEEVLCVVATTGLVACATNARLLRLFTPMGTQRQVISLAGPVVALAGFGSTIMAVYHYVDPGVTDQHLAMDIIAVNGRQVRNKTVNLPLTPSSKLTWLGATDVGSPCTYDNCGILRIYDVASGIWLPLCDMTNHSKGVSDAWFIVSVSETTQAVRAILCRGASFPLTVPKPTVVQLPLQIPLCEVDTEKGQLEEQLLRWAHTSADVDIKAAREVALKLFALACRNEIEQRAFELMELLKDDRLLPLAAKYASRLSRMHLSDKLTNLAETWERETNQLNIAQNSHFHELDTQENENDRNETQEFNTSLIIPHKVKEKKLDEVSPIKPAPLKPLSGTKNPFKKQQETVKTVQNPLTLTERVLVEVHATSEPDDDAEPLKIRSAEKFLDWFTRNKGILEKENPELTPSELNKLGVRTFKNLQQKVNANGCNSENVLKRKLDDCDSKKDSKVITSVSKQAKLSAFAYSKKEE